MRYTLVQLAQGSYDILLDGEVIGSVVRAENRSRIEWFAELLEEGPADQRPAPFQDVEYSFRTFAEICAWLGNPQVSQLTRADTSH
jgi:hypothetical protein